MVHGSHAEHHLHKRKRSSKKTKWRETLDKAIYISGFVGLIMTVPQLWKIWIEKVATGVSALSWATYAVIAIIWILYGIEHKEKPIVVIYICWFLIEVLVVIGTILYG